MLEFTRPALSLLVGLVLAVYGIVHLVVRFPAPSVFEAFISNLPHVVAVALFQIGIAAVLGGLIMLTTGVRGIRGRLQEIQQTYGGQPASPRQRYEEEDPDGWYAESRHQ